MTEETQATPMCTEPGCDRPAEYRIRLMNDPDGQYCEEHARESASLWMGRRFPSPSYERLSDGQVVQWRGRPA